MRWSIDVAAESQGDAHDRDAVPSVSKIAGKSTRRAQCHRCWPLPLRALCISSEGFIS